MSTEPIPQISRTIDQALNLLGKEFDAETGGAAVVTDLPNLLEECLSLCSQATGPAVEPIRTIHHFSCTGGTLLAKCIASMPNVLLLNEVDPLSPLPFKSDIKPEFTPTDMVSLLRQGDPHISSDLIERLFVHDLELIKEEQSKIGRSLVLRDHTHSHFLTGEDIAERPTLRDLVKDHFPVKSIITVRDPIDSYLSMKKLGWHQHFSPPDFEEYCRRYLIFLDKYQNMDSIKYEEFVALPKVTMQRICGVLELNYSNIFTEVFDTFRFSGDSGRQGGVIEARPRKEMDAKMVEEAQSSSSYKALVDQLGYRSAI